MVIASELKSLRFRNTITIDEKECFASELMACVLDSWNNYDPARATRHAFINVVVTTQLKSLLRARAAQKRSGITQPLDDAAAGIADPASLRGKPRHQIDIRLDLAAVLPHLTTRQLLIVDHLRRNPLAPLAEQLGIPRRSLRDECDRIREIFRDRGLEEYL